MLRSPIAVLCLFSAIGAGVIGCHRKGESPRARQAVRVELVNPIATQTMTVYSGTAQAQTQVSLSFKVGGYVDKIATVMDAKGRPRALQAGDHVEQGMILGALRESDYKAHLAELSGMSGDASSAYKRAKADYARASKLVASGAISQAEFETIKARYGQASGSAAAANARVSGAQIALADTRLKAPFDGIVLTRSIEVGALVSPGASGFVVADTATMRIVFGVPDSVQRVLSAEQTITATTDALPGRSFSGAISKIAAQADAKTRAFDIEATVDNEDQALKVGMVMQVQIDLRHAASPSATLVPLSAVVRPPDAPKGFGVFVAARGKDGDVAQLRKVELGELVTNRVTVTQGLAVGERIIVQGAAILTDGQRVNVLP